jgi:hypothetical protein
LAAFALSFCLCALWGEKAYRGGMGWRGDLSTLNLGFKDYAFCEYLSGLPTMNYMLYQGFGKALPEAKESDVLFLGNSLSLFAFRDSSIRKMENSSGLKFFNMALDATDGFPLSLDIIRRHQLHPKFAVINENYFFQRKLGPFADETIRTGPWQGRMKIYEHWLSWNARLVLHRWLPVLEFFRNYSPRPFFYWRSLENGGIVLDDFPRRGFPIQNRTVSFTISPSYLENARQFKAEMQQMGIQIILVSIPHDEELGSAPEIAKVLKVPLITPRLEGLQTFDRRHLTEESGARFADAFFREFIKDPGVRTLMAQKVKMKALAPEQ